MIHNHRVAGWSEKGIGGGKLGVNEYRQCCHCQYVWEYQPGSGTKRGYCLNCNGLQCLRPECAAQQRQLLADFPELSLSCLPLEDWNNRMREKLMRDPKWKVLPSGIAVMVDM